MARKNSSKFIYFSSVAIEMAAIIGLFTYAGVYLDRRLQNHFPWGTVGLSLLGVFLSLYYVIKNVLSWQK